MAEMRKNDNGATEFLFYKEDIPPALLDSKYHDGNKATYLTAGQKAENRKGIEKWNGVVVPALYEAFERKSYPDFSGDSEFDQVIYEFAYNKVLGDASWYSAPQETVAMAYLSDAFNCDRLRRNYPISDHKDFDHDDAEEFLAEKNRQDIEKYLNAYVENVDSEYQKPDMDIAIQSYQAGVASAAVCLAKSKIISDLTQQYSTNTVLCDVGNGLRGHRPSLLQRQVYHAGPRKGHDGLW